MKNTIFILIAMATIINCRAQSNFKISNENYESQVLEYTPIQNANVSENDFKYGTMILEETKKSTDSNPGNFNIADYFNVLSAFLTLKESEENIMMAYEKFRKTEESCEYFLVLESKVKDNPKYDIIRSEFSRDLQICKQNETEKTEFDIKEYCRQGNLDLELVSLIHEVYVNDRMHRGNWEQDWSEKQKVLDNRNQEIIDSLFLRYETYLGTTLVGEEYNATMWSVIQHSNMDMMERYLPIIHKATKDNEIDLTLFKMLIDRYYGLRYGYQLFGTQAGFGFEMADEKTRHEIISKYDIE